MSKCGRADVKESLEAYKSLGYDGVFITNHFIDENINIDKNLPYEEQTEFYFSNYEKGLELSREIGRRIFYLLQISSILAIIKMRGEKMKRIMSIILFILSCLTLIASISFCLYILYDLNRIATELANNPSASGIDYLGNGWEYGIVLFVMSSFGLAVSTISSKLLKNKRTPKYISVASIIIFVLLLLTSVAIFYS